MEKEERKLTKNQILEQNKLVKNNKKEENVTFNINLVVSKKNKNFITDSLLLKHSNTISYSRFKYFKFFSFMITKITNKKFSLIKQKNIKQNKTQIFSDKIIQTPASFFKKINTIANNSHFVPKINKKFNIKNFVIRNSIPTKNTKKNNASTFIKSKSHAKIFSTNPPNLKNPKFSRNKLKPIMNFNKVKETKIKKLKRHLTNGYTNNPISEQRKHNNLLNIENIYIQGQKHFKNFISNRSIQNERLNRKFDLLPLNRKITIKKIKYPLVNSNSKKIQIINENNEHLLEKIYKNQTLSNFNNKYELKYKTNDVSKKENIEHLFSLLKMYKNSEKDKKDIFDYYSRSKKKKKYYI